MRVGDVMTQDVATVAPHTDLKDVAALLVQKRISGVPVWLKVSGSSVSSPNETSSSRNGRPTALAEAFSRG